MRKLILASLTISSSVAAQTPAARPRTAPLKGSLEQRLAQLIDAPPFNRATWGIYVVDDRGRVLYQRNAARFSVSARCDAVDTLAPGVGDSTFAAIDAIADSVRAKGIRRITGKLVGDGSYFEP